MDLDTVLGSGTTRLTHSRQDKFGSKIRHKRKIKFHRQRERVNDKHCTVLQFTDLIQTGLDSIFK